MNIKPYSAKNSFSASSLSSRLSLLHRLAAPCLLSKARELHALLLTSGHLSSSPPTLTSLISLHSKCSSPAAALAAFCSMQMGHFYSAREYFDRILEEGMAPSRYTVTGILSVFTCNADFSGGRRIHGLVVKIGYGFDVVISNSLIDFYGKCHAVEDADEVFESMFERDVFSWNSILAAFEYSVEYQNVLQLFGEMLRDGVQLDSITVVIVLPA